MTHDIVGNLKNLRASISEQTDLTFVRGIDGSEHSPRSIIESALDALAERDELLRQATQFFSYTMPKMNVAQSALDGEAIQIWNRCSLLVERMQPLFPNTQEKEK